MSTETMEEKRLKLLEKMKMREKQRSEVFASFRAEHGEAKNPNNEYANARKFLDRFVDKKNELIEKINGLSTTEDSLVQIRIKLDKILDEYEDMKKSFHDNKMCLTAFETEQCRLEVKALQEVITSRTDELLPKKKFTFGNRQRKPPSSNVKPDASIKNGDNNSLNKEISKTLVDNPFSRGFKNRKSEILHLTCGDIGGNDVSLYNLNDCNVTIARDTLPQAMSYPSTIHLDVIENCTIICGPALRSVFITKCTNSTLILACRQLRIHQTNDVNIYIHVTSRAIIEDCNNIRVAPYLPALDEEAQNSLLKADLDIACNNWDDLDDFFHLAKDVPSPNWSILPVEKRKKFV